MKFFGNSHPFLSQFDCIRCKASTTDPDAGGGPWGNQGLSNLYMGLRQADLLVMKDLNGEHHEKSACVMKAPPAGLETSCS